MTVREFNGTSDELVTNIGSASSMTYGTAAMILKFSTLSGFREFCMIHNVSNAFVANPIGLTNFGAWQVDYNAGGSDFSVNAPIPGTGIWLLAVVRKDTGSSVPRMSMYNYNSGLWTHGNANTTSGDGSAPGAGAFIRFSYLGSSLYFGGRVAARALWANSLPWAATTGGDTAIETSGLKTAAYVWNLTNPTLFQLFNQASTATSVPDLSSAGTGTQASISGTTVISGDDPPGFSFSLTPPQPLAAWNFDEASGGVLDLSGNSRGFSLTGTSARSASGHTSKALTQSSAEIQDGPSLTGLQTPNRTIMAWVYQTAAVTGWVLEFHISSISSGGWGILFLSNQYHIQARHDTTSTTRASAAEPSKNAWHHVAGTYDGANVKLYLDGTLAATTALATGIYTGADIFRVFDASGPQTLIDDVRLYDEALDATAISSLMNTPVTGVPSSGTNVYFSNGAQASGVYEMTTGGILVQRNSIIAK